MAKEKELHRLAEEIRDAQLLAEAKLREDLVLLIINQRERNKRRNLVSLSKLCAQKIH